jgi:hypothetical protein
MGSERTTPTGEPGLVERIAAELFEADGFDGEGLDCVGMGPRYSWDTVPAGEDHIREPYRKMARVVAARIAALEEENARLIAASNTAHDERWAHEIRANDAERENAELREKLTRKEASQQEQARIIRELSGSAAAYRKRIEAARRALGSDDAHR